MANYDPQDFGSVIQYMRWEFGARLFRDAPRMQSVFLDLSPKLEPYGNVMRQLIERGALSELEAASGDAGRQARAMMKARDILENKLLLGAERVDCFLDVLRDLYGIAQPTPRPVTPPPVAQPSPRPVTRAQPSAKIVRRGECGDNVAFTLGENGVLTISGNGPMRDFDWNIDTQVSNTPWWKEREAISVVIIRNGVTKIANWAFYGCAGLKSVVIPDSVTKIGISAFSDCVGLTSVVIPDSVTYIGAFAFDCAGLKSVVIPDSVTEIGVLAFSGCKHLTSASIPAKTKRGDNAFPHGVRVKRRK